MKTPTNNLRAAFVINKNKKKISSDLATVKSLDNNHQSTHRLEQAQSNIKMEHDIAFNIFNNSDDNGCDSNDSNNREPSVYVFGYGSLVWNPGFEYSKCITGCEYFDSLCR